jgi:hypothetical protein
MGDCGAPRYMHKHMPDITTDQLFNYYTSLGFDYGISLDHIIGQYEHGGKGTAEQRRRRDLTINNNFELLERVKKEQPGWYLIGSIQAWSAQSFRDVALELAKGGFKYLAMGGPLNMGMPDSDVADVLKGLSDVVNDYGICLHVLGVTRYSLLPVFKECNVITCDSATHMVRAVIGPHQAYLGEENGYHAGLVMPKANSSFRAKRYVKSFDEKEAEILKKKDAEVLQKEKDALLEKEIAKQKKNILLGKLKSSKVQDEEEKVKLLAERSVDASMKKAPPGKGLEIRRNSIEDHMKFGEDVMPNLLEGLDRKTKDGIEKLDIMARDALRSYDRGEISLQEAKNVLLQYLRCFDGFNPKYFENFITTLENKPWQKCGCQMCQDTGVDIVLLRSGETGCRRIFHNLWKYYRSWDKAIKELYGEEDKENTSVQN